jgi:NADH-quinone oxidoreductase subunit A
MTTPTMIAGYLALFATFGLLFLFVHLVMGKFVRPKNPNEEKLEVYECGEPTIGSSFVQFDLRFYVVALLFIIFDVEVAFFFPWATVFGKAVQLTAPQMTAQVESTELAPTAVARLHEMGFSPESTASLTAGEVADAAHLLALTSLADIGVFFAVLLVGFAYVWKRGDLNWVRAVSSGRSGVVQRAPPREPEQAARPAASILSA